MPFKSTAQRRKFAQLLFDGQDLRRDIRGVESQDGRQEAARESGAEEDRNQEAGNEEDRGRQGCDQNSLGQEGGEEGQGDTDAALGDAPGMTVAAGERPPPLTRALESGHRLP